MMPPRIAILAVLDVPVALAQSTLPSYTRAASATKRIKTAYGDFAVWFDEKKWTLTKETVTEKEGRLEFTKGPTLIQVITDSVKGPTDLIPEAVLRHYKEAGGDARIVSKEQRSVNGKQVLSVQFLVTTSPSVQRAYCYFHGGTSGTFGLIALTPENVFDHEAGDIADFLNSIEISDEEFQSSDLPKPVLGTPAAPQRKTTDATDTQPPKLTKKEQQRLKQEQEAALRAAKAQKKKDDEARENVPTQADVVERCVTVRRIVFKPAKRGFFADHAELTGTISNRCGGQVEVSISISFYSASGDFVDLELVTKLAPVGETPFWSGPEYYSDAAYLSKAGKVTNVSITTF